MTEKKCPACAAGEKEEQAPRKKKRSAEEEEALLHRLCRIEGQVKALQRMVREERYCPDILTQAAAARAALDAFSRTLLESHLRTCVAEDLASGREEAAEELIALLRRMQR